MPSKTLAFPSAAAVFNGDPRLMRCAVTAVGVSVGRAKQDVFSEVAQASAKTAPDMSESLAAALSAFHLMLGACCPPEQLQPCTTG
ncbi:hypothetical protein [Ferrovibrio xuzhouensis]|uniref:Uncharacterized protein n=1 Tax=Ferrovibrio xuzhouensis TaxID=1576914 RepID=A0ABV7VD47_9PROT